MILPTTETKDCENATTIVKAFLSSVIHHTLVLAITHFISNFFKPVRSFGDKYLCTTSKLNTLHAHVFSFLLFALLALDSFFTNSVG